MLKDIENIIFQFSGNPEFVKIAEYQNVIFQFQMFFNEDVMKFLICP